MFVYHVTEKDTYGYRIQMMINKKLILLKIEEITSDID